MAPIWASGASVRGFTWRERLDPARAKTAIAISQRHELPELLGRVLAARDIALDEVAVTLDPTVKALLPDPSTLRDMDKAASRLADAIERREAIAIFGDYDVDGACSSALLKRFLQAHGLDARIYIPDRLDRRLRAQSRGHQRPHQGRRQAHCHRRLRHDEHRRARSGSPSRRRSHRRRSPPGRRASS